MIIRVCIGSSCHLKGSPAVVASLEKAIEEHHLQDTVTLAASFCVGKCNPTGVTVQVDDNIHVGVTADNFKEFFQEQVLNKLEGK